MQLSRAELLGSCDINNPVVLHELALAQKVRRRRSFSVNDVNDVAIIDRIIRFGSGRYSARRKCQRKRKPFIAVPPYSLSRSFVLVLLSSLRSMAFLEKLTKGHCTTRHFVRYPLRHYFTLNANTFFLRRLFSRGVHDSRV